MIALAALDELRRFDPPDVKSMMSPQPILSPGLERWESSIGVE